MEGQESEAVFRALAAQFGTVAEERRDFAVAEGWYRKVLEISERLQDQYSAAIARGSLQRVAATVRFSASRPNVIRSRESA